MPAWITAQVADDGPLAAATLVVTRRYHHLRVQPVGRARGRDRWWLQARTLDNGPAWLAQGRAGSDSYPGVVTFTVGDGGDRGDLRLLAA